MLSRIRRKKQFKFLVCILCPVWSLQSAVCNLHSVPALQSVFCTNRLCISFSLVAFTNQKLGIIDNQRHLWTQILLTWHDMYDNQLSYECLNEANESINSKFHVPPPRLGRNCFKMSHPILHDYLCDHWTLWNLAKLSISACKHCSEMWNCLFKPFAHESRLSSS